MDKYEYNLKLDQMKTFISEGKFESAAEIADSMAEFKEYVCSQTLCESIELCDEVSGGTDIEWGNNETICIKIEKV